MESFTMEQKKEKDIFPVVREEIMKELALLSADETVKGQYEVGGSKQSIAEGDVYGEATALLQMKIRAGEKVLKNFEEKLRESPSSRELYMQAEMTAKTGAIYRQLEKLNAFITEAGHRKDNNPNFAGVNELLRTEIESLLHTL